MILTKEVEIKPTGKNIQYYKDKGYDAEHLKPIMVKVGDLPENSHAKIEILCSMCKNNKIIVQYDYYNKRIKETGSYVCKECSCLKAEQTKISRYGDVYFKTEEFKDKRRKTCIERYGFESPLQNESIMEKTRNTNLQKYGCENPSQVEEFKEKMKTTLLARYGVDNPFKSEDIREKCYMSNLKRYGVKYATQSPEIRAKVNETLYKNGNQKTSKQQVYLHNFYGGKINYPVSYYATDICFPEEKLIIEYDGGGHALRVTLGRLTQEEFNQKEIIRNNIIKREGYKQMRIISSKDKLPSDQVLLEMLSDARQYFSLYPNHSWIEFNISTSTVRNAENPKGLPYSFGSLRTIKDSDLNTIN